MNCLRYVIAIGTTLIAAAAGCGDNGSPPTTTEAVGNIQISIPATPDDVVAIHVTVTSPDFVGSLDTDLVQQPDHSWLGTVLDVLPGTARTVTAEAYDIDHNNVFEAIVNNVTVFGGKLTDVQLVLKPKDNGPIPVTNTPPHFITLLHPDAILSTETATLFATADDPDANTHLTYTWSVLSGGGSLSLTSQANQIPGNAVSTVYTPVSGFTGFAVIQVEVTDGLATMTTTFPIAVGAGIIPDISFDVLPDLVVSGISYQSLMPSGTTQIQYTLTNPDQAWTPATMVVNTTWTDSCGGSFDAGSRLVSINKNDTASQTITYTAPASVVSMPYSCQLTLTIVDEASVQMTFTTHIWVDPPMVMFVSSEKVTGGTFSGQWENADAFCQNLADSMTAVVPTGTYHALLSFDEINAIDRLIDAPYIRVDGTPIARNKAELFALDLLNAVRTDEHNAFNGASAVYTGTQGFGVKGDNCLDWTSSSVDDTATSGGSNVATTLGWTASGASTCDTQLPIYCVQQPSLQMP